MPVRAILFDLDGTLLDTLEDIAAAANLALERQGLPTHPPEAYRQFIGGGVALLCQRALPAARRADEALIARCVDDFRAAYDLCWNVRTRPFDGIPPLLDALTARGLPLAVLSNKPNDFTRRCADQYLLHWPFPAVLGQRDGVPPKPDPAGALEVATLLNLPARDILYVGDSAVDMETARRAGMRPIGVAWGFRPTAELLASGAEAIIDHPAGLLDLLGDRAP